MPSQRQAEADDTVRITLDAVNERTTEALERERTGDFQRLASGDVPLDIILGELAEMHFGVTRAAHSTSGCKIDKAVAGPQFAGRAAHTLQSFAGNGLAVRLAVAYSVQEEHRITTKNQRSDRCLGESRLIRYGSSDRFGDGRHIHARKITCGGDFRFGIVNGLTGSGLAQVPNSSFVLRIPDFLGFERVSNNTVAGRGGSRISHITIRTMYGLGFGGGQNHHTLLDTQIIDSHAFLTSSHLEHGWFIHMRYANRGADAPRIQHIAAWLGLGCKD